MVFLSSGFLGFSQINRLKKGEKQVTKFEYSKAIITYEKLAKKGSKNPIVYQNLGDAYFLNTDFEKAAKYYSMLLSLEPNCSAETYFRYALSLKSIEEYTKSDAILTLFASKFPDDSRSKLFRNNPEYLAKIPSNNIHIKVKNITSINSEFYDFGGAIFNGQLIFSSSRSQDNSSSKNDKWTLQNFTNLYTSTIISDTIFETPHPFSEKINTKVNESTPVFNKEGTCMYFTRNNYNLGKKGKNEENIILLKIYKSEYINEKWSNAEELPFNSDFYNTAHPALSPDGKYLYFASDMPGSKGQSDIYRVPIDKNGDFGTPENLGAEINTEGKETFPYISDNNELYFASDGHPGLGGLDIFMTKIKTKKIVEIPINLGAPYNSSFDDFGFCYASKTTGFLTSNRKGGKGFDDIYFWKNTLPILDEEQPLPAIITAQTPKIDAAVTNVEPTTKTLKIAIGDDLAKLFQVAPIYFDLDKSFIRTDAALELQKILNVLKTYPNMKIEINSHTDSRASFIYNEKLSERRAKSTLEWLVSKGISRNRLTAKGYGEYKLINVCMDNVDCTEEAHQANRRSEFIVKSL